MNLIKIKGYYILDIISLFLSFEPNNIDNWLIYLLYLSRIKEVIGS